MKRILFLLVSVTIFSGCANAQKMKSSEVPAAVKSAFERQYPDVKDVDWEKEDSNYEAGFEVNKIETSVVYDVSGNLIETEVEIAVSALPQTAQDYIAKNYPKSKISEAAKITDASGAITYEAEVGESDLIFDANGNFVKEIKEKADKED